MRIAIIGAGNVGSTLGSRFAELGHDVVFGVRDPAGDRVAAAVGAAPGSAATTVGESVGGADVAILAVPLDALDDMLAYIRGYGGVVIDAVNAVRHPVPDGRPSVAEYVAAKLPGAKVAKAFNTVGFEIMLDPVFPSGRAVLPVAGDPDARATAAGLAESIGFEVLDVGNLDAAPLVEAWAKVWIHSMINGRGRSFAFGVLER